MLYEIITAAVLLIIFVIVMVVMHNKITAVENQNLQAIKVQNNKFAKMVETEHKALDVLRAEDVKFKTNIDLLKKEDQAFSDKYAKFEKDQNKRFEEVATNESVNRRFVDMERSNRVNSESVDRRFVDMERSNRVNSESVNRRFVDMERSNRVNSESVDRRFVDMERSNRVNSESVDRRFVDMERSNRVNSESIYNYINNVDNNANTHFYYIQYMIFDVVLWMIDFMLVIFTNIFDLATTVQELQNNYASLGQRVDTESVTIGGSWKLNANNNTMNINNNNNNAIKIMNDRFCIQNVCVSAEDLQTIRSKNGL
jgi:cell division protein FtsB